MEWIELEEDEQFLARIKTKIELSHLVAEATKTSPIPCGFDPIRLHKTLQKNVGGYAKIVAVTSDCFLVKLEGSDAIYTSRAFDMANPIGIAKWRIEHEVRTT